MTRVVHVAAAVIRRGGRILLARRPEHLHQGGLWEFPGGKLEAGESTEQALHRELQEELGIELRPGHPDNRPLIQIHHDYGDKQVFLDVWTVAAFAGEPEGREGQPLCWVEPDALPQFEFPAANLPIVQAARLPDRYLISGDFNSTEDFCQRLQGALQQGVRLVQLRLPQYSGQQLQELVAAALAIARPLGCRILLNHSPQQALTLGCDGVHLSSTQLRALTQRPLAADYWVAASCHNAEELMLAQKLGVDFAVLSPVQPTLSHPQVAALGWRRSAELIAAAKLPVYALGGLTDADLTQALSLGAQGIAAIRAWWGQ